MNKLPLTLMAALLPMAIQAQTLVYVGTDTGGASQGIYATTLDETTGRLSPPRLAAAIGNPSGAMTSNPRNS